MPICRQSSSVRAGSFMRGCPATETAKVFHAWTIGVSQKTAQDGSSTRGEQDAPNPLPEVKPTVDTLAIEMKS